MGRLILWIYRILMTVLVPIAIPVLVLSDRLVGKRRPPWSERFARRLPDVGVGGLWIHAVSVGEVEVARRLIDELSRDAAAVPIIVTSTTATGLALARKNLGDRASIIPTPVDLPGPVGRVFDAVQPRALVLVETELWPEMLHQAGRRGVPVVVVNARLSDGSFRRYRRIKRALRPLLRPLSLVLTRDATDAERFKDLGIEDDRVAVGGNVKYDLEADRRPLEWGEEIAVCADGRPVIVAGSTLEGEERLVLDAVETLTGSDGRPPLVILAPRHPERFASVAHMVSERGLTLMRRSRLPNGVPAGVDVFLLDTIGELARSFQYGAVAFIGGSLVPSGGHNPLEPAVWGIPVLSGPWVANFEEIYREMVAAGGVRLVADARELSAAMDKWLSAPETARLAGEAGRRVVEGNRGATARIAAEILKRLDGTETR
ncbi:MAG: 3-deoxy-D-manno-octulosonic acid transferase [Acidobacteria bacterium]|nr:3-deoxy-D-manno-octulosonic acid transferase [Acidobacteriota bacterium]